MAFSEFELKKYEKAVMGFIKKNRPPPHIRSELDISYRLVGQSVEIFAIRPCWDNPQEKMENSIAKATYVKTQGVWKIYWQRADLRWHSYEPNPKVKSLEEFFTVVESDEHACFFG